MKLSVLLALLGSANTTMLKQQEHEEANGLSQLVVSALAGAPPGVITEVTHSADDKEDQEKTTEGQTKNYTFRWKYACAWTKWVPSNQFLHAGTEYKATSMTLERFGFIGMDKKCFWGMTGVFWKTPLKVTQIKTGPKPTVDEPVKEEKPVKMVMNDEECKKAGKDSWWPEMNSCITEPAGTFYKIGDQSTKLWQQVKLDDGSYFGRAVVKPSSSDKQIKEGDGTKYAPVKAVGDNPNNTAKTYCRLVGLPYENAEVWEPERTERDLTYRKAGKYFTYYKSSCNEDNVKNAESLADCEVGEIDYNDERTTYGGMICK